MNKVFVVPEKLLPLMRDVYRMLVEDCEKDVRIEIGAGAPMTAWLRVLDPEYEKKDGIIRASGGIGPNRYKLFINPVSACFEADGNNIYMVEQVFYLFIMAIASYRNIRGLSPLDTGVINGLTAEDSPPVNAENYAELQPNDKFKRLGDLINKNFFGVSLYEQFGCACYYICSTVCQVRLPLKYVPVYTALIDSFMAAFPVKQVQLFAVRWATVQRLYFVTEGGRIYCCKTDDSLEFLKKHADIMFDALSKSFFRPESASVRGLRFTID
jgi:hypothetical protein